MEENLSEKNVIVKRKNILSRGVERLDAFYLRVSTREQKESGHSIANQYNKLMKLADKANLDDVLIYNDEGVSATKKIRPDFDDLENKIDNDRIKKIWTYKLDRLLRDFLQGIIFLNKCREKQVEIETQDEKIDLEDPYNEFYIYLKLLIAHLETRIDSVRTKGGIAGGFSKSLYAYGGTIPYGFIKKK